MLVVMKTLLLLRGGLVRGEPSRQVLSPLSAVLGTLRFLLLDPERTPEAGSCYSHPQETAQVMHKPLECFCSPCLGTLSSIFQMSL